MWRLETTGLNLMPWISELEGVHITQKPLAQENLEPWRNYVTKPNFILQYTCRQQNWLNEDNDEDTNTDQDNDKDRDKHKDEDNDEDNDKDIDEDLKRMLERDAHRELLETKMKMKIRTRYRWRR